MQSEVFFEGLSKIFKSRPINCLDYLFIYLSFVCDFPICNTSQCRNQVLRNYNKAKASCNS